MDAPFLRSPPSPPGSDTPAGATVRILLWTAAVCGLLSAVLLVLVAVHWAPLMSADRGIAHDLHRSAVDHPGWTRTNRIMTDWVWDPWTLRALVLVTALLLAWRAHRMTALWLLAVTLTGSAVQQGVKAAVGRPRPRWPDPVDSAHYASFPSGHAMTAALACCLLLWLLVSVGVRGWWLRSAVTVGAVSVVGVGFTRLYLGVHWLSDVVAGWLMGVALAAVAASVFVRWPKEGGAREVPLSRDG
ncbi:phosphatase PAP2 family protein [Streptomyces sp. 8N706]|uniref:phosphatase PAP2 family protein n=1 Tax=Streptomyces sp. 8N706 TaxID=3457416 RepID=UPI003FD2D475